LAKSPIPQDWIDQWPEDKRKDMIDDLETLLKVGYTITREPIKGVTAAPFRPRPEVKQRIKELENAEALVYPRIEKASKVLSVAEYERLYQQMKPDERRTEDLVTLRGKFPCRLEPQ
jgi:hypothetical protein